MNSVQEVSRFREQVRNWIARPPLLLAAPYEWLGDNLVGLGVGRDRRRNYRLRIYTAQPIPAPLLDQLQRGTQAVGSMEFVHSRRFHTIGPGEGPAPLVSGKLGIGNQLMLENSAEAGVLGAFVSDQGKASLLCCRHVLDPTVAAHNHDYTVIELGAPSTRIGTLTKSSTLSDDSTTPNYADWSLAQIDEGIQIDPGLPANLGSLDPLPASVAHWDPVTLAKIAGQVDGIVVDTSADIDVDMPDGNVRHFVSQILVMEASRQTFAFPGDSGTLVVTSQPGSTGRRAAVGIVCAVNEFKDLPDVPVVPLTLVCPLNGFPDPLIVD
jgi:hypothetical protein